MNEEGELIEREDQDHPLLNDLVLGKLFEYVRPRDLLGCRGVCLKWNVLTIPFTRSKFTICIQLPKDFLKNPRNLEEENTQNIEKFVEVFGKDILEIPFAKFKIGPFCTTDEIGQQFLKLCANSTTELLLFQDKVSFKVEDVSEILRSMKKLEKLEMSAKLVTDSRNVVELFPGSKPKLKSLKTFYLESESPDGVHDCCPTFLEELITAAENISDLSLVDLWGPRVGYGLHALSAVEQLGRESSIRRLSLDGVRMNPHVEMLRRLTAKRNGLKLKQLSFFKENDEEESSHSQMVELFKETLEDLEIISPSSSLLNFPKMPKLRRLKLVISTDFNSTSFDMNKHFPILMELELWQKEGYQVYDEFLPQSEECLRMKSLSLSNGIHFRIGAFNRVLTLFPGLTKLSLTVKRDGPEILRQIWTRMTQLEFLNIYGQLEDVESLDSLFCDISIETFQEISDVVKHLDKIPADLRRDTILKLRNQHCGLHWIGNLTNLKCLELNVRGGGDGGRWSYLSDVSGFLGFYSLEHLSRLVLRDCELTKTCCEILTTEMEVGLETWSFGTKEGEAIIPDPTY